MNLLPFALIVIFGVVAFWMRTLPSKVQGTFALVSAAMMVVFLFMEPNPQNRYRYVFFAILGFGIGLQRFGVGPRKV